MTNIIRQLGVIAVLLLAAVIATSGVAPISTDKSPVPDKASKKCESTKRAREFAAAPYYTGLLFDGHLHLPSTSGTVSSIAKKIGLPQPAWDKELSLESLNCLFEAEGVGRAYSFHLITKYSAGSEVAMAKKMNKLYPRRFVHFLMPTMVSPWINPSLETVTKILEKNPGLFKGLGELKMFDGKSPNDPFLIGLYDLAKKYGLVVMMHPFGNHLGAVEDVVKRYPEVKFLFHSIDRINGKTMREDVDNMEWVMNLIRDYPNVYYSVDSIVPIYGYRPEHMDKEVSKESTLLYVRENFEDILEERSEEHTSEL